MHHRIWGASHLKASTLNSFHHHKKPGPIVTCKGQLDCVYTRSTTLKIYCTCAATSVYVDKFHLTFNFKSKVSRAFFKAKMNVNWHHHFISKCHLNFGLHNILGKLIFWIINMQSWFFTIKNYQSSVSILRSCMFLQVLKTVAHSIASTSSPQKETRKRASRVFFKFNLLRKWLLIAFCMENPLSHCLALFPVSLTISDNRLNSRLQKKIARAKLNLSM